MAGLAVLIIRAADLSYIGRALMNFGWAFYCQLQHRN